ncbi:MAG TPA: right-handed parallel beta-helix repeat-containing protein, partial [Polyangia bacterium]|nr:right-handed parallel beta-helix repeat-containing protein [Polyangia bacterium]
MRARLALLLCPLAAACGGGASTPKAAGGSAGATTPGDAGGTAGTGSTIDGGRDAAAPDVGSTCEAFGHFAAPTHTFTLPVTSGGTIDYADIQKSLPAVDWQTLDR